jgi:cyanophycinase
MNIRRCFACLLATFAFLIATIHAAEPAPKGSLVIVGGGGMPDGVRDKFMTLAGGKDARLVVIPTASEYADKPEELEGYLKPWRKYEPAALSLVHTRSRETANDPAFVKPIAEATAVWFSGGDQSRIIEAYRGTTAEKAFNDVRARGGVLGGTSAGAAIMSEVMITGGREKADLGRGFGFLPNAVVDQHFLARSRLNRLIGVVAEKPDLIGIGIDESTAFVVEGDRWSVVGDSFVLVIERGENGSPLRMESLRPGSKGTLPASGEPFRKPAGDR